MQPWKSAAKGFHHERRRRMTPQALTDNLNQARLDQFGPDQPAEEFPDKYFLKDVFTIAPDGQTTQRAPRYCATDEGAQELVALFTDNPVESASAPIIVYGNAINFAGLQFGWKDNKDVPYLKFVAGPSTAIVNGGLLLDYFNHGFPANVAMDGAVNEVQGGFTQ
jgi:hypothetical protein